LCGRAIPILFWGSGSWTFKYRTIMHCANSQNCKKINGALRYARLSLGILYISKKKLDIFKFRYGFGVVKVRVRIWVALGFCQWDLMTIVKIRYWFRSHDIDFVLSKQNCLHNAYSVLLPLILFWYIICTLFEPIHNGKQLFTDTFPFCLIILYRCKQKHQNEIQSNIGGNSFCT